MPLINYRKSLSTNYSVSKNYYYLAITRSAYSFIYKFLFAEAYDADSIGFVDVTLIKERIKAMHLSEKVMFHIIETFAELADDEMVSLVEFRRLFKAYTIRK